ncbi:MAG: hypothetical protein Q9195_001360 [Heterodermia aff. obscurata]
MASVVTSPSSMHPSPPKKLATSKLKSIVAPRNRSPSDGIRLSPTKSPTKKENANPNQTSNITRTFFLPPDHPHNGQQLKELGRNPDSARSPQKPIEVYEDESKSLGLHKRTKSAVSLKSLMSNEKVKSRKPSSPEKKDGKKPKKTKSSTGLSALFTKSKSSTDLTLHDTPQTRDKENTTPPPTANTAPPPIWAQFVSQPFEGYTSVKVPLNDARDIAEEIALYTPAEYSPSKGRNFMDYQAPTLARVETKPRPKSALLSSSASKTTFTDTISGLRKRGYDKVSSQQDKAQSSADFRRSSSEKKAPSQRTNTEKQRKSEDAGVDSVAVKRGSRVMAAVAAFNGKSQNSDVPKDIVNKTQEPPLDPKAIESAFESLLESRNIPPNVRDKMRSLNTKIKADFIRKETSVSGSVSSSDGLASHFVGDIQDERPKTGGRSRTDDGSKTSETGDKTESSKKTRPRSLTFTRSKESVPTRKAGPVSHSRTKSSDNISGSVAPGFSFVNRVPKPAAPEDYISYLHKVQKPQLIEVARIQKLRQLLRNEAVSWVDAFITQGGMAAVVNLLYRIIEVEWREEHEDTLLHETLLCLKALCTTSLALQELPNIHSTLFPTLLGMLFDKEKKGPSEFSTRSIIISLLFTYLSGSAPADLTSRARILLSYLRDPSKPEEAQPPGFIASIYHPRPYRIWCNEIVSVTKEVFWIFLHHTNIVPFPDEDPDPTQSYRSRNFPRERAPVPAAPYIGGVEWDATNYLAAHLDLLNGIVASLPSAQERNALRQEFKDSGFEKCMGASLRTCKEKFYGFVHAGLTTWIGAAREDGWGVGFVREGPEVVGCSSRTPSPKKKGKVETPPPRLDMPRLELGGGGGVGEEGWL